MLLPLCPTVAILRESLCSLLTQAEITRACSWLLSDKSAGVLACWSLQLLSSGVVAVRSRVCRNSVVESMLARSSQFRAWTSGFDPKTDHRWHPPRRRRRGYG